MECYETKGVWAWFHSTIFLRCSKVRGRDYITDYITVLSQRFYKWIWTWEETGCLLLSWCCRIFAEQSAIPAPTWLIVTHQSSYNGNTCDGTVPLRNDGSWIVCVRKRNLLNSTNVPYNDLVSHRLYDKRRKWPWWNVFVMFWIKRVIL